MFFARIVSSFHDFSLDTKFSVDENFCPSLRHIPTQIFIVAYLCDTLIVIVVLVGVLNNSAMSAEAAAGSYSRI